MSANNQDRNHVKCWQFVTKRPYINSFKFRILHKAMQSVDVIESQMNKKKGILSIKYIGSSGAVNFKLILFFVIVK